MHAHTCQQGNAKNPSRQASIAREPELADVQAGFRKGRGARDQIANIRWITEKTRTFQKNIYLCFIDYTKAFDCVDHDKLRKALLSPCHTLSILSHSVVLHSFLIVAS